MQKIDFVNSQQPALNDTNLNLMQDYIETAINAQVSGDTLPVGAIMPYGSDVIPENWLLCDGQEVSRTTYATLFQTIGTTYGEGDGSTTFNLPNLKGKIAVGKDTSQTEFDNLGEAGGEKTHTLTVEEMPSHKHNITGKFSTETGDLSHIPQLVYQHPDWVNNDVDSGWDYTGGGQAHNNLQPYQVTNYIIKAYQSAGIVATVVDNLNSESSTNALSANQGRLLGKYSVNNEIMIGHWINNEPIYRKVIHSGAIQSTTKSIAHNISNLHRVIHMYGMANTDSGHYFTLPRLDAQSLDHFISLDINSTTLTIGAGSNADFSDSYVVIEYTKNS